MSMIMHRAEPRPGALATTYKHFYVERPCRILVVADRLKPKTKYQGLIRHISVGGVMIDFNAAIPLPPHFFIEIVGFEGEHGATRVHRVGTELGARFNMPLPSDYVSRIIRAEFATGGLPSR
ncbi:hypothetical protein [Rhizobium sp. CC-YZS058]|uniref:hypothetical protein n=1 Tax=Rhizobium sp. CC-YZS058 TaxID=3042153 RepID=UPI002B061498|nr:hypothetical protein [Rhizobium sp. CC-YZS058]MEA3535496.1 hypothetical protein [Rhizobium sp. CC-YZS058]